MEEQNIRIIDAWALSDFDRCMALSLYHPEVRPYWYYEAFKVIRGQVSDKPLIKYFGNQWAKIRDRLFQLSQVTQMIKTYHDRVKKEEVSDKYFRDYQKAYSSYSELGMTLSICFTILSENSNLKNHKINNQAFKDQIIARQRWTNRGEDMYKAEFSKDVRE